MSKIGSRNITIVVDRDCPRCGWPELTASLSFVKSRPTGPAHDLRCKKCSWKEGDAITRTRRFRAYDHEAGEWVYSDDPTTFFQFSQEGLQVWDSGTDRVIPSPAYEWTGQLDVDQKPIWEGDIIEYCSDAKQEGIRAYKVVEWKNRRNGWNFMSRTAVRVVGNIVENPNFVKKTAYDTWVRGEQ